MCLILRTRSVLGPAGVTREHCARAVLVPGGKPRPARSPARVPRRVESGSGFGGPEVTPEKPVQLARASPPPSTPGPGLLSPFPSAECSVPSPSQVLLFPQKKSRNETYGEGSGVEILENRPYTDGPGGSGQYTHKVYHVGMHIPSWFRSILPKAALRVVEESWNAYPYTRTRWGFPHTLSCGAGKEPWARPTRQAHPPHSGEPRPWGS